MILYVLSLHINLVRMWSREIIEFLVNGSRLAHTHWRLMIQVELSYYQKRVCVCVMNAFRNSRDKRAQSTSWLKDTRTTLILTNLRNLFWTTA
jgi:hypothetical protein